MQQLLPLYLIICILPGIAALSVLAVLAVRFKNKGLIYYLISFGSFTISLLVNFVMFYFGVNISEELSYGIFALISFNIPFSVIMHTAFPLAVNELVRPPGKRWIDLSIILVTAIELVIYWTPLLMHYSRITQTIELGPVFPFVGVIQVILIAYSIGIIFLRRKAIMDRTIRRYILILACIIAAFLPVIAYDQLYFSGMKSIETVPIALIFSPIFYFIFSLTSLIFGLRVMSSSADNTNKTISQKTIIQTMAKSSGLSAREITIIPLIARGLGNKQIAGELNISPKTVGNHIYNIYRKLDITSRYELLVLLK